MFCVASTSASSSCRSSSPVSGRSLRLLTSAPTYAWLSSTWRLPRRLPRLSSPLRPASRLPPRRHLGLHPHALHRPSGGCHLATAWPTSSRRPWPRRFTQWLARRIVVALPPQPMDRVHPYVARVHPWRSSRSTTSRRPASITAASPSGWCALGVLHSIAGPRGILLGAPACALSYLVAMDYRVPRQRL